MQRPPEILFEVFSKAKSGCARLKVPALVIDFSWTASRICVLFVVSWFMVLSSISVDAQDSEQDARPAVERNKENDEQVAKDKVVYKWPLVDHRSFLSSMSKWLEEKYPASDKDKLIKKLESVFEDRTDRTRSFAKWLDHIDPEVAAIHQQLRMSPATVEPESFAVAGDEWIRASMELYHAVQLAKSSLHDESVLVLKEINQEFLIDPGTYFFYRGICDRQLIKMESAKASFRVVLRHQNQLPIRYLSLAGMMLADLEKHQPDSLSEVSRLMADAQRRQSLERHTEKVLEQEDEIVKTLDKVIERLEQQKRKMQAASDPSSRPSGGQNAKPTQSEQVPGGQNAKGIVESKNQSKEGDWGAMQRNAKTIAVSNLVRDLPPHYRTLIEAYFQKLAEEKND